ncbi:hypothetical protein JCGZ_13302 [Jatropha curcas]|uniref:C3H1-type domain-containing protein n=1 Tax=Jatropha curcas TaxID=180498 RepID=A0A067K8E7_JATCU|nr:hypothetical protein JCGZ_13302 [Jatropha curcas]
MEEELQKRNTDCVYFLASPLTCKKGMECEYRHNEIARLNPRDCWYWLAGNCLNPTCGFRHPPLENHAEAPSESESSSVHGNKSTVPCYFYFSGFCNKGDRCSFMHGPDVNTPTGVSGNSSSVINEGNPLDNRTSVGNDILSVATETYANPSEMAPKAVTDLKLQPKENIQLPAPKNIVVQSPSPQIAVSHCEEAVTVRSDFLLQADSFIQSRSNICSDQSSEDQMDDCVEPEERWESSPGFDVLVDDKSENIGYEDDQDYLLALDREHRELNNHFLGYDFEDLVEYDPTYCEAEAMYEGDIYDSFDCVNNVHIIDDIENGSGRSRSRVLDSLLSRKRKILPVELAINDRRVVDLRERLRKHRVIHGHPVIRSSRRQDSSRLIDRSRERTRSVSRRLDGRLASEVGKNAVESHGDNRTLLNGDNQRGWLRQSRSCRSRQRHKEKRLAKRQFLSSEVPRKPVSRERKSTRASIEFSGPKTLAQIKEEKKKAEGNGDGIGKTGNSSRMALADFEGPKPLSEILKDKRRMGSVQDF